MLSAQQQQMTQEPPPDSSSSPQTGFGKVLSSLQGLQQRLDDFSVEEVTQAHARAIELIRQLGALHARLETVNRFKQTAAGAEAAIEALPGIDLTLIETDDDGLQEHPRLRAMVKAAQWIERHRTIAAEPAAAAKIDRSAVDAERVIAAPDLTSGSDPGVIPLQEPNGPEAAPQSTTGGRGFTLVGAPQERRSIPDSYNFAALKLETQSGTGIASKDHNAPPREPQQTGTGVFDDRLLRDLIDAYGEFAAAEKAPDKAHSAKELRDGPAAARAVFSTKQPDPISGHAPESAGAAMPPATRDAATTATETAVPDPKHSKQLALPAPAGKIGERPLRQPIGTSKARGQIDQQLKSIIKDYGEVDLYSHKTGPNTKVKAIAGGLLALLLLSALYFLAGFASTPPPKEAAAVVEATMPTRDAAKDSAR